MKLSLKKIINNLSNILLATNIVFGLQLGAQALTFTGRASGEWGLPDRMSNPNAVIDISSKDGGTNNRLTWGTPGTGGLNNFVQFNGIDFNTNTNTVFNLGKLYYRNGSTLIDTNFNGDFPLYLSLSLTLPLNNTESFEFLFNIFNTPNTTGNEVLDGDILQFATAGNTSHSFNHEGVEYTLKLIGFSTDGGETITNEFNSPERSTAKASLFGKITVAPPPAAIPEPSVIVGLSLLSLYLGTRQRK
ncbi:choice-of-anchor K domain-containing protein [Aerosakkonemataceae cyanobacterium BLCC-F154]|uniref:Choice-of-anchor K domain-containing protein n=1 Tax=Floridaenema fluviatile BLCC-F154 TaxID=3153640 RepID=A0ABV4YKU6_9CYAN